MKVQIRQGVFETNSSSLHSLTIIPISKWGKGELLMDSSYLKMNFGKIFYLNKF